MTGNVKETYLSNLHKKKTEEGQSTLANYTTDYPSEEFGTVISVVREPTGGIRSACDEHIPELGMPKELLDKLRETKERSSEENEIEAHNQAVLKLDLEEEYREYLETNDDAKRYVNQLSDMVAMGETITLVCFEKRPKWCHRHILKEVIENRAEQLE